MMQFSAFIESSLQEVSQVARENFGRVQGTTKSGDNNQVLTVTDLEVGQRIIARVQEHFPSHNIIDEEVGVIDHSSEFTWVIDPIDGTSNFANGVPTYGIMLGVLKGAQPVAGGVILPAFDQLFLAEKGEGAFCNQQHIRVTTEDKLLSVLVAYGVDGHQEHPELTHHEGELMGEIALGVRNLRTSGSTFDTMMVAAGKYGAAMTQTSKIWDHVAQHIIIEEAGGVYTDFWGKPMNYEYPLSRVPENYTYCAGAPAIHQQLQAIIHQVTNQ